MKESFKFIDLFAGLGGFHQAALKFGGRCVFASELHEVLRGIYGENFGIVPHGDIRLVELQSIPSHDVLFAGFPCQPFSKAGKQMGWLDAVRGTLFENIIDIAKAKAPRLILLENVAHFVRHDSGNTYKKVREALEALGYRVFVEQFSPHDFGVPHIRERFYLVATMKALESFRWPECIKHPENDIHSVLDRKPQDAASLPRRVEQCLSVWQEFLDILPGNAKLPSFPIWATEFGATYPYESDSLSKYSAHRLSRYSGSFGKSLGGLSKAEQILALPSYARGSHVVFPKWKKNFIRQNRAFFAEHEALLVGWRTKLLFFPFSWQKFEWNCQGELRDLRTHILQFRASGLRVKRRQTAPSLVAMTATQIPIIPWERRYMTVKECARLQSMGDLRHLPAGELAMTALGNAVNVKVVTEILREALPQAGISPN